MKTKKPDKMRVHDLRDDMPVRVAVPDVSAELAGGAPSSALEGPNVVSPSVDVQATGQTTHE